MRPPAVRADRTRGAHAPDGAVSHDHRGRGRRGRCVAVREIAARAETRGRHIPPAPSERAEGKFQLAPPVNVNNKLAQEGCDVHATGAVGGGGDTVPPRGSEISPSDAALDDASDSRFRRFFSFFLFFFSFFRACVKIPVS